MVRSNATSVNEYLNEIPPERKRELSIVRAQIIKSLNKGFSEAMNWGMISYEVPLKTFAETYNGKPLMFAALASQKDHMALYLTTVYADPEINKWFRYKFEESGHKLDMGDSCIRFKSASDLPLDVISEIISRTNVDEFVAYFKRKRK